MRKAICVILMILLLLISACSNNLAENDSDFEEYLEFDTTDIISCYSTNAQNSVYLVTMDRDNYKTYISEYDVNGTLLNRFEPEWFISEQSASSVGVYDSYLYISGILDDAAIIYRYDITTGVVQTIPVSNHYMVERIVPINSEQIIVSAKFNGNDENTSHIIDIDFKYGNVISVSDYGVISISTSSDGRIFAYYASSMGEHRIAEIDTSTLDLKREFLKNIEGITSFACTDNGLVYYSPSGTRLGSPLALCYSSFNNNGISEIMPNCTAFMSSAITVTKDFTYVLNSFNGKVERLKNSVYIIDNEPIKMICSSVFLTSEFSAGYSVEFLEKTDEELALAVLSNDNDFDAFYINSQQSVAQNLKNNGVFYALNDVQNVREYIDTCFPYIKEAAVDDYGNIWMIPIDVSIPIYIYNENNISSEELENAVSISKAIKDNKYYYFNLYSYTNVCFAKYLRQHTYFDEESFGVIANDIKILSKCNSGDPNIEEKYSTNKEFMFSTNNIRTLQVLKDLSETEGLKACSLTNDDIPTTAVCTFICVNPSSKNLKPTLSFISELCGYMLTLNDTCMLSNLNQYTDTEYVNSLYKVYESAFIDFNIPSSLYMDEWEKYLNDKISLSNFIESANRIIQVYLNE